MADEMKITPSAFTLRVRCGTSPKYDIETLNNCQVLTGRIWGRTGGGVVPLRETIRLMGGPKRDVMDRVIEVHGGCPVKQ